MNSLEKLTRLTVEVDPLAEVRTLVEESGEQSVCTWYAPRDLTLDDLVRATKLIDFQDVGFEVVVVAADGPSSNGATPSEQQENVDRFRTQLLAFGLDDRKTKVVQTSTIGCDRDYLLDVVRMATLTPLDRVPTHHIPCLGEDSTVGQLLWPVCHAVEIEYLDADLVVADIGQRDYHGFARDQLPLLGYAAPPVVYTPLLAPLETGIGLNNGGAGPGAGGRRLSVTDSYTDIEETVMGAFCPPSRNVETDVVGRERRNPVLQRFEYLVFPHVETVRIDRPEEYGDSVTYKSYSALEADLESGALHPVDAKHALVDQLEKLIAPVRDRSDDFDGRCP